MLFRALHTLIGIIPFSWLYVLSDVFAFVAQYIVRYRRDIVDRNLRQSFPEKSDNDIKRITRGFYRNLSDIALESIKGYSLNINQLMQRYRCLNPEIANSYFKEGQSVIFALSHYANWEWGTQVAGTIFLHDSFTFYKPISNKYIDKYIRKQRSMRGMELCSTYQTKFIFRAEDSMPRAFFLVSDQNPSRVKKSHWLKFLNQDTACIQGIERYAYLFNLPVIYADIQRVDRGRYTIELDVICENPKNTQLGNITELYMKKLEEIVVRKPEDWLWSHKRWKVKKPVENIIDFKKICLESI